MFRYIKIKYNFINPEGKCLCQRLLQISQCYRKIVKTSKNQWVPWVRVTQNMTIDWWVSFSNISTDTLINISIRFKIQRSKRPNDSFVQQNNECFSSVNLIYHPVSSQINLVEKLPTDSKHTYQYVEVNVCTYGLCGRLWRHAVFADGEFESVFNARLQLWAGDSQYGTAGAQTEVQTGAVLWAL